MGNNTRIATLLNGAISLLAVVAITLVCIVPTAFAEDGANTSDAPYFSTANANAVVLSTPPLNNTIAFIVIPSFLYFSSSLSAAR